MKICTLIEWFHNQMAPGLKSLCLYISVFQGRPIEGSKDVQKYGLVFRLPLDHPFASELQTIWIMKCKSLLYRWSCYSDVSYSDVFYSDPHWLLFKKSSIHFSDRSGWGLLEKCQGYRPEDFTKYYLHNGQWYQVMQSGNKMF